MRYWYANWELDPEGGRGPKLPPNDGFLLMAEPGHDSKWALFRVSLNDEERSEGLTPISDELVGLLLSGEMYPPALALARDEVERHFEGSAVSHADFEKYYCERLRQHLAAQDTAGYLLAKCLRGQGAYLREGSYYWLVDYIHARKAVRWVSPDYFVYTDPAAHFDVPRYRLHPLARWRINKDRLASDLEAMPVCQHPGEVQAAALQEQIDDALRESTAPLSLRLGPGSEDTHLASNVDVLAEWPGFRPRHFTLISHDWAKRMFDRQSEIGPPDVFAVGAPLIIVKEISGSAVVRAILRQLQLEDCRW